jgi:hypothetical protein
MSSLHRRTRGHERGAATLVIVMVLFLVMALLAAYANRGLMFEQRMASSYFRSSLAQEAAEAGIEWTLSMLNGTATDAACKPVATGGERFLDRYLLVDPKDRSISPRLTVTNKTLVADCARNRAGDGWSCQCPTMLGWTAPAPVVSDSVTPSFGISVQPPARPDTIKLVAYGCSGSVASDCVDAAAAMNSKQLAQSTLVVGVGLVGAVRTPPAAPLIVKGSLDMHGPGLGLHNTDAQAAGMLFAIGGAVVSPLNETRMESLPGTASTQARIVGDAALSASTADEVFRMFMGATGSRYRQHPALRELRCSGDCAPALEAAYKAGQRMIWVTGALQIASDRTLGTVTDPLLIIADGDVMLEGPFQLNGMLVARGGLDWINNSGLTSLVTGIVLVTGDMATTGQMDILYRQSVADHLRNRMGSYVRAPGSWIDTVTN